MWGTKAALLFAMMVVLGVLGALASVAAATPALPISGTVTDRGGEPLAGIEVCAVPFVYAQIYCDRTDAAGEYTILGAGPGYQIHFYDPDGLAPSHAPQWYPGVPHAEGSDEVTEAQIEAGIDAVMGPGAEVRGRVVARAGGAPLAAIEVCLEEVVLRVDQVPNCDETGADGEFVVSDLGPGNYRAVFEPSEGVNYVADSYSVPTLGAGSVIEAEARLVAGVEFEGHVTDGATGLPIEPVAAPGSTPTVCAIETFVERALECVPVGAGGSYRLAGLRAGGYVLVFSADEKEEGVDLHPDGYVRQYYDHKSSYEEALVMIGEAGSVIAGRDATLVRGEEIWPEEEDASGETGEETGGGETSEESGGWGGGQNVEIFSPANFGVGAVPPVPPPVVITRGSKPIVLPRCRKEFHRVAKGSGSRCVKIVKKPKRHLPKKTGHR